MKCKKEIPVVLGILFIFGTIVIGTTGTLDSVYGQTNSTANQTTSLDVTTMNATTTTTAQEEASNSIKGSITEAGQFLSNATQKVTTSKLAGALLNDTSNTIGNAYVETKKFFSPN